MKKATALVIAAMMLLGLIGTVWAEEPVEVQLPDAAETETAVTAPEAPAAQEEAEPAPAEEKAEEETAAPEQTAEPETDASAEEEVKEETGEKSEEKTEEKSEEETEVPEQPAEAEKSVVSQPVEEKAESENFTADVTVYVPARIRMGKVLRIRAMVSGANMKYTLHWEKKVVTEDDRVIWKTVQKGGNLKLVVDDAVLATTYRLVLTAADGTVRTYAVPELKLTENAAEETEEPEEEIPDEAFEEDGYYVEELEADEEEPAVEPDEAAEAGEEPTAGEEPAAEPEAAEEPAGEPDGSEADGSENADGDDKTPAGEPETPEEPEETDEAGTAGEPGDRPELPELIVEEPETEPKEPEAEPDEDEETVTEAVPLETLVLTEAAALREQADGMSSVLAELPEGAEVCLIAREGDWLKVSADGTVGYIRQPAAEEAEAAPEAEPVRKVTIFTSRKAVMTEGESIELTSELEGFENNEIRYQWECDKGEGFEPVEGANDATYIYAASLETLGWDWRLTVYYR